MKENNLTTILEVLAKEIEELQIKVRVLTYENEKLKEELELFTAPREHMEVKKNA